jgi:hypothetical protein
LTQYAITIDTEEEWDWSAGWPVERHSLDNIQAVPAFRELCARHGARSTWFTNWSVMENPVTRDTLLSISEEPDVELGMHIHPWLTPPCEPDVPYGARESYLANLDGALIQAKLETNWGVFESNGCQPVSFRGGRYSSGPDVQRFLQQKGFIADASVVPYTAWDDDGAPDYRHRDIQPNRLAPITPTGPALWELPVTLGFTRRNFELWAKMLNSFENSALRHLRLIGILQRTGIVKRIWLNFEDTPATDMLQLIDVLEAFQVPCICLTVHSSSLYTGGNPYSRTKDAVERIWKTADTVMEHLSGRPGFEPATICEIAQKLESKHESHRD